MKNPAMFIPDSPDLFIGTAKKVAAMLTEKANELRASGDPVKILFYGSPGTGKTTLANMFAKLLAGHSSQVETYSGRNVTLERVRYWQESQCYLPLYGSYTVKIVNELDLATAAAQETMLQYLDEMKPFTAFIGTSNLQLGQLAERFQSRLQQLKINAPVTEEIAGLLSNWKLSLQQVNQIAVGCGGNVRAALLDCQSMLDAQITQ